MAWAWPVHVSQRSEHELDHLSRCLVLVRQGSVCEHLAPLLELGVKRVVHILPLSQRRVHVRGLVLRPLVQVRVQPLVELLHLHLIEAFHQLVLCVARRHVVSRLRHAQFGGLRPPAPCRQCGT